MGQLVVGMSPELWRFGCEHDVLVYLPNGLILRHTRVVHAIALHTRERAKELEDRSGDDDHKELE